MLHNLHPIQGTHWVLDRRISVLHFIDEFGVKTTKISTLLFQSRTQRENTIQKCVLRWCLFFIDALFY